jgi:DAPG hydrolase PhiG domain
VSDDLTSYLSRPLEPPSQDVLDALERGPMEPRDALSRSDLDRLLDPSPLLAENGWCTLPDGVGYVAVRTPMPGVTGEMVDWWFDWHPRDPVRYRIWHPLAHHDNSLEEPPARRAKAHWGAVHHPVEDLGSERVHARIAFAAPTEMGLSTDALDHPAVATIVCGYAGDDRRRVRHSLMIHTFLRDDGGTVLRSQFWLGAALRPYLPGPLAAVVAPALNTRLVRRVALPADAPRALAGHCAEEYANLATLLPELYSRFGRS